MGTVRELFDLVSLAWGTVLELPELRNCEAIVKVHRGALRLTRMCPTSVPLDHPNVAFVSSLPLSL